MKFYFAFTLLMLLGILLPGCGTPAAPESVQNPAPVEPAKPARKVARLPSELPRQKLRESQEGDWFVNVASAAGVDFAYSSGAESGFYQLLESVGGGAALLDFDQDGNLDIFISGGGDLRGPTVQVSGAACCLYRNLGDFKFEDVTASVGLDDDSLYTHGVTVGDYNRDGWPDLFVAGYGGVRLYRNEKGKSFTDVTAAAKLNKCNGWNVQGAFADLNRDGWLDLYILTYAEWQPDAKEVCDNDQDLKDICGPTLFDGAQDQVYFSNRDGTFENVTAEAGIVPGNRGLGVTITDVNEDGWQDIFVANDVEQNQLYLGGEKLPYREEGVLAGVAFSTRGDREGSMGVATGDFNRDGRLDIFYTNYANQDNSLCESVGPASFIPAADKTGLSGVSRRWVGFGTVLVDFDNDGWQDIAIANGHVAYDRRDSPFFQAPQLFQNKQGKRFVDISPRGGPYFSGRYSGRGIAAGDLNNDGAYDLVVVHQDEPVAILKNTRPPGHWVRVQLRGVKSNTGGVGARITLKRSDRELSFWSGAGDSYASASEQRVIIPLLDDQPVDITVTWPSGGKEVFSGLEAQVTHELVEGMGRQP